MKCIFRQTTTTYLKKLAKKLSAEIVDHNNNVIEVKGYRGAEVIIQ